MPARAAFVATVAVSLLALALAPTASAVIVRLNDGRSVSYQPLPGSAAQVQPFDTIFHNLDYNGGAVMPSNTNYAFYWAPSGSPAYPADYQPGIDQFFEDLAHDSGGHDNADSVSTQYNDSTGAFASYDSHFGGAIVDTNPYPANGCELKKVTTCLADSQIRAELTSYLRAHNLPMDLTHEYFVMTPPGVESCFGSSCSAGTVPHEREAFCAYHGASQLEGGAGVIVYSNDPYVAGGRCDDANHPNGSSSDATLSAGLSHEHNESITDPEPSSGWTDWVSGSSMENGDQCRTFTESSEFGTPLGTASNGAKYNQVINGHLYWYQQEWSNQGHTCLQRFTQSGEAPKAAYTFTTDQEEAKFDASGSTAPGGVAYYEWQLNEFPGETPQETTSPTFSWGNTKGVLRVALTVFAADGSSAGTMHVVNIGNIAVPTVTKVSPNKGPVAGGTLVTITGTNLNAGVESVRFGSTPASFKVLSTTKLTAISPAAAPGLIDITVATYYGTSPISSKDHFKYVPTVTSVTPNSGTKAGGTSVTVTGTGFLPGTSGTVFKFGTAHAKSVNCASSAECTLVTPPATAVGTVDVLATVNKASSLKVPADRFTYN